MLVRRTNNFNFSKRNISNLSVDTPCDGISFKNNNLIYYNVNKCSLNTKNMENRTHKLRNDIQKLMIEMDTEKIILKTQNKKDLEMINQILNSQRFLLFLKDQIDKSNRYNNYFKSY